MSALWIIAMTMLVTNLIKYFSQLHTHMQQQFWPYLPTGKQVWTHHHYNFLFCGGYNQEVKWNFDRKKTVTGIFDISLKLNCFLFACFRLENITTTESHCISCFAWSQHCYIQCIWFQNKTKQKSSPSWMWFAKTYSLRKIYLDVSSIWYCINCFWPNIQISLQSYPTFTFTCCICWNEWWSGLVAKKQLVKRFVNTLRTGVRYIRTWFRPKKQQFSVASPTP